MMKKIIAGAIAGAAILVGALPVFAGGKNATYVKFTSGGSEFDSYWMNTGSGLVHEWRYDEGGYNLHFVFKPAEKFEYADCDSEDFWFKYENWSYSMPPYGDTAGDEADLGDFITAGDNYRVCAYREPVE